MNKKLTVFRELDIQPVRDLPFFEEVLEGTPHTLTSKYYHDEQQGRISGEWEASTGAWRIDYKVWEFCHVLSGRCVIELEGCAPSHWPLATRSLSNRAPRASGPCWKT